MAPSDDIAGPALASTDDDLAAVPAGEAREVLLSQLLSELYLASAPPLRARLLECLLKPMRPLGLVAVAAGAFGGFVHRESWARLNVPIEDALHYSAEQVFELARYIDQFQPEVFQQVARLMADNPVCLQTLSGSLLLLALRLWTPAQANDGQAPAVAARP